MVRFHVCAVESAEHILDYVGVSQKQKDDQGRNGFVEYRALLAFLEATDDPPNREADQRHKERTNREHQ